MDAFNQEEMVTLAELVGADVRRNHLPQKTATEDGGVESVTFTPEQLSAFISAAYQRKVVEEFLPIAHLVNVSFKEVPEIAAFLHSVRTCDDRTMLMRMAELRGLEMPQSAWNVFGIVARVALMSHPAYGPIISVIQEKGGIWNRNERRWEMKRLEETKGANVLEIDFSIAPEVNEFVRFVANCDEEAHFRFRMKELAEKQWTVPQWNLLGVVANVILPGRSQRKDFILALVHQKRDEAETNIPD